MDQAALYLVELADVEGIGSPIAVGRMACEQVIKGDEHGMAEDERRPTVATACGDTRVLGR